MFIYTYHKTFNKFKNIYLYIYILVVTCVENKSKMSSQVTSFSCKPDWQFYLLLSLLNPDVVLWKVMVYNSPQTIECRSLIIRVVVSSGSSVLGRWTKWSPSINNRAEIGRNNQRRNSRNVISHSLGEGGNQEGWSLSQMRPSSVHNLHRWSFFILPFSVSVCL